MDSELLEKIEEQRSRLEENLAKLKKSLRHWQTLELDYDALREEFFPLKEDATPSDCLLAAQEAGSDLVKDDELQTLLNDSKGVPRRPSQIVDLLSKRSEYVARNINSLRKEISETEKNRNALLLSKDPDLQEDAGLPLSEVIEELDDDGNIVSSRIQHPGKDNSQLVEVIQKAGVKVIDDKHESRFNSNKPRSPSEPALLAETPRDNAALLESPGRSQTADTITATASDKVLAPTNPDDTEEDARLRQEMLQYGLDEVGHIVAELELTEDMDRSSQDDDEDVQDLNAEGDDYDFDNDDNDEDWDEDEDEDSEDDTGRTKRPVISAEYRKKMEDLQQRLGLKNLGPDPNLPVRLREQIDRPPAAEAARKAAIARAEAVQNTESETKSGSTKSAQQTGSKKKKVAFATKLDIAPEKEPEASNTEPSSTTEVSGDVIERTALDRSSQSKSSDSKPVSRFKAARSEMPETPMFPPPMEFPKQAKSNPEGPPGQTIADTLVERSGAKHALEAPAPDEDDFDEELHRREVAAEYHKMRNKKIHEQGGFVGGGEQDNYGDEVAAPTVVDESSGRPRKISRFKAARMQT